MFVAAGVDVGVGVGDGGAMVGVFAGAGVAAAGVVWPPQLISPRERNARKIRKKKRLDKDMARIQPILLAKQKQAKIWHRLTAS